jgi:hypothetical protein
VQQQPEVEDAHEEQHCVGVDAVVHGAVDLRLGHQGRQPLTEHVVRLVERRRDLGLAASGHVGLEPQRLGVGQRGVRVRGHRSDEVGHAVDLGPHAGRPRRVRDDRLAQQVVLGTEAAVHRPGRQPRLADDVHDLGAVVALPGEHGGRSPQQAVAQLVGARGSGGVEGSVGGR